MLTDHQRDIYEQSLSILKKHDRLVIKGSAGVGKTFLVNTLIKALPNNPNSITVVSAPTHKAVAVLRSKVSGDVQFQTTHSVLKLKRHIDRKTGKEVYKPSYDTKYPPLKNVRYLVVDEASMLSTELLKILESHAKSRNTTIIFLGDDKQLYPVGEKSSPVFEANYPTVELTQIIRQGAGNPIIDLSRNLQDVHKGENKLTIIKDKYVGYVYTKDQEKILKSLCDSNGSDETKYLAFTNNEVRDVNNAVRRKLYGSPAKIEVGETLIFNAPYRENFSNNEEVKVKELVVLEKDFKFLSLRSESGFEDDEYITVPLKYYTVNPGRETKFEEDSWFPSGESDNLIEYLNIIHEDSEELFKKIVSNMAAKAKLAEIPWITYYETLEMFADVTYNHALTIHKAQGSTYKVAIIDVGNIEIQRDLDERNRLLYTAITRAAEVAVLYNT